MQLSDIRRDGGTQMRDAISETTAQSYAEHLQDGAEFPPVIIFHDGSDYWLADGFHRCKAYEIAGITDVPTDVRSGSRIEAVRYALKANATNGRPRTGDDMRRAFDVAIRNELCEATDSEAVKELLGCSLRWARSLTQAARTEAKAQRDAEIMRLAEQGKTQREIAEEVGVTQQAVSKISTTNGTVPNVVSEPEPPAPADDYDKAIQAEAKRIRLRKAEEQKQRNAALAKKPVETPEGKYDVIVIDPPWEMEKIARDVAPDQVDFDYPTMPIEKIKELELPAADNCHLFMWITHKHLPSGFDILNAWGAKYILTMVWAKNGGFQPFGLPQYNCEFILYARIGSPKFTDLKQFNACFQAPRRGHSVKPDEFYDTIRRVTDGKRIDMFNRREIKGFDVWGNES